MNAPRKLPVELVEQLMRRLVATYGRRFWQQWEGVEPSDVKAVWARELAGFDQRPEVFAWAFENMPEQPPNAIEFRNLCRRAPAPAVEALPMPPADPVRAAQILAKAREAFASAEPVDGLSWARKAIAKAERGERVSHFALHAARAAMNRRAAIDGPAET